MKPMHDAAVIGPMFDQYRATTNLMRREIAAELGMTLRALDGVMCRYRKQKRDAAAEAQARDESEVFEFVRSGLGRPAATAPPLPTADDLAVWYRHGCSLGGRLAKQRERAA